MANPTDETPHEPPGGSVEAFLDSFIGAHLAGDSPSIEEFSEQVPRPLRGAFEDQANEYLQNAGSLTPRAGTLGGIAADPLRSVGPYQLHESLGQGGMATVYRATDTRTGDERAVKVLHGHLAGSHNAVKRFERETQVAMGLRHPRLVAIVDSGSEPISGGTLHYLVMDQVFGSSVATTAPPEDTEECVTWALRICIDVCDALEAIHAGDVIHRDIKPGNILLDDEGRAAVADFGLARLYDELALSLTATGQILGTPYYMSPEQVLARRVGVDARTDLFSLGAVLYELLTGKRPFDGDSESQLLYAISFGGVRPLREVRHDIPKSVETVCLKALEKAPAHRYSSAASMGADLRRCLSGAPLSTRRPGAVARAARKIRRQPARALIALLVVASAGVGAKLIKDDFRISAMERQNNGLVYLEADGAAHRSTQPYDTGWGGYGPPVEVGGQHALVAPGLHRFTMARPNGAFIEFSRVLAAGETLRLAPDEWQRPGASQSQDAGEMILIPSGPSVTGLHDDNEHFPKTVVELPAFYVDRLETTMGEYKAFLDTHPDVPEPKLWRGRYDESWTDLPAAGMRWAHARMYAESIGKRLLTQAEWLRVARGPEGRPFIPGFEGEAWRGKAAVRLGDDVPRPPAVTDEVYTEALLDGFLSLVPAPGSFPEDRGPEGAQDVLGSVCEWVDGVGHAMTDSGIRADVGARLYMGLSWCSITEPRLNITTNAPAGIDFTMAYVGIRCARSVAPPLTPTR